MEPAPASHRPGGGEGDPPRLASGGGGHAAGRGVPGGAGRAAAPFASGEGGQRCLAAEHPADDGHHPT